MTLPEPVPSVRVVLLNYNGGETIVSALRAVIESEWPADRLEVVCVDNGSRDGSVEVIESEFPSIRIIRNERNLGFPGNNVAMCDLDGVDFVALVNSDAFVEPGWLEPLVARALEDDGLGAVCPKISFAESFAEVRFEIRSHGRNSSSMIRLRAVRVGGQDLMARCHVADGGGRTSDGLGTFEWIRDGSSLRLPIDASNPDGAVMGIEVDIEAVDTCSVTFGTAESISREFAPGDRATLSVSVPVPMHGLSVLNNVGSWLDPSWTGHERGLNEVDLGQFDESVEVGTWCGAAVLLRAEYLQDVGLFEESFFLYYEDTDLAVRGRERGWRFRTEPTSRVRHLHSASTIEGSKLAAYHIERNRLVLILRHAPMGVAIREHLRFLLITGSYAHRSIRDSLRNHERPDVHIVRRRFGSLFGAVAMLPSAIAARAQLKRRRLLTSHELEQQLGLGSS